MIELTQAAITTQIEKSSFYFPILVLTQFRNAFTNSR
jgi:hypothetical protein